MDGERVVGNEKQIYEKGAGGGGLVVHKRILLGVRFL